MREDIAKLLLKAGSVTLSPQRPFTWASGIKSPIYCDNRLLLSFPKIRNEVIDEFEGLIKKGKIRYDAIAGIATAGIPHAAILADRLRGMARKIRLRGGWKKGAGSWSLKT